MREKFYNTIKELNTVDKSLSKIMNFGFIISFALGILGIITLLTYKISYISYDLIDASILLFQMGILFTVQTMSCGYTLNFIMKKNNGEN